MFDHLAAYEDLKQTYDEHMASPALRACFCPSKEVRVIKRNEADVVTVSENIMKASDRYGNAVCKTIEVNDETGEVNEIVQYNDALTNRKTQLGNLGLTQVRCGLMTCLAIKKLAIEKPRKVGYIGNGRINLENCEAITRFFGKHEAVIRGSARNRAKNKEKFDALCENVTVDDTERLERLSECDVIISCTSTCDPSDAINNALLADVPLVIALDSGYVFDESFRRERELYTDHPEQLIAHYADEFPYDKEIRQHKNLTEAKPGGKAIVHLFGVAIADLVVAKHFVRSGCTWR